MVLTSTFGWLDFDEAERRRVMELVDLFREKGTLDELGLGTIRDTIADQLFPGVTTIQTRARYFLFIPWIYLRIEAERMPPERIDAVARDLQWKLVQSLTSGGESEGVIGIEAGRNIQRPPSAIYWLGLRRWGICQSDRTAQQYQAEAARHNAMRHRLRRGESNELLDIPPRLWHGGLPEPPPNVFEATTFALTPQEALYLIERVQHACEGTLLAACLAHQVTGFRTASGPWALGGVDLLSSELRADIRHAEVFSLGMEGAVLLYNLMLAEDALSRKLEIGEERVEAFRAELARWADEMLRLGQQSPSGTVALLRSRILQLNPRLHRGAVDFSMTWLASALKAPRGIADDSDSRQMIRRRERRLKGSLARLSNLRALENWSGASGVGRMVFRWPNARQIILDIHTGLRAGGDDT